MLISKIYGRGSALHFINDPTKYMAEAVRYISLTYPTELIPIMLGFVPQPNPHLKT